MTTQNAHYSRRSVVRSALAAVGSLALTHAGPAWAEASALDPRTQQLVKQTIGIDTHNHIDVPMTAAEMPGPDLDLRGELKRSGLSAIVTTFATDYQRGDPYERFHQAMAAMDRQLERNGMKRSLSAQDLRSAHERGQPTVIQAIEGAHFLEGKLERVQEPTDAACGTSGCCTTATPPCP